MKNAYLGIDIGSISTKGVIINNNCEIIASDYRMTEGNPIQAVKDLIKCLKEQIDLNNYQVISVGTTGSARKLIGTLLGASVIKNEITAHAVGTTSIYPQVRTIFEIGGQDSKIILLKNGIVTDYAMNTLCAAGTGSFLSSQSKRLGVDVKDFGKIALTSKNPAQIAARCTVFAESDLVHKAQIGCKKEDIIAGLVRSVAINYLNNVGKGELGVAILAKKSGNIKKFDFNIEDVTFETKGRNCHGCSNQCEIICIYRNHKLIDSWGNRCEKGQIRIAV